jgi:hypothetical protein
MGATSAFKTALLQHIFQNANLPNIGDATGLRGSTTAGSFYVSLHTADPTSGNQSTSEATYTGYARVAVVRTSSGWTVAGGNNSNTANITFGTCTGGTSTVTHFGIGSDVSGVGNLFIVGTISPSIAISTSSNPEPYFPIGQLDVDL